MSLNTPMQLQLFPARSYFLFPHTKEWGKVTDCCFHHRLLYVGTQPTLQLSASGQLHFSEELNLHRTSLIFWCPWEDDSVLWLPLVTVEERRRQAALERLAMKSFTGSHLQHVWSTVITECKASCCWFFVSSCLTDRLVANRVCFYLWP